MFGQAVRNAEHSNITTVNEHRKISRHHKRLILNFKAKLITPHMYENDSRDVARENARGVRTKQQIKTRRCIDHR